MSNEEPAPNRPASRRAPSGKAGRPKRQSAPTWLTAGAAVAITAIIVIGGLIYSDKICSVEGIGSSGAKRIEACSASRQVSAAIKARNDQEITATIGVIAGNVEVASQMRRALLQRDAAAYLATLKEANLNPITIENELIDAGFYSQDSQAMEKKFDEIIKHAIDPTSRKSEQQGLLSTGEYEAARGKIAEVPLLQLLR